MGKKHDILESIRRQAGIPGNPDEPGDNGSGVNKEQDSSHKAGSVPLSTRQILGILAGIMVLYWLATDWGWLVFNGIAGFFKEFCGSGWTLRNFVCGLFAASCAAVLCLTVLLVYMHCRDRKRR